MAHLAEHAILSHLDNPPRFLFWTVQEALVLFMPLIIGLGVDCPKLAVLSSALAYFVLKHYKRSFGKGTLRHVMYWYLPHNKKGMPVTPSSTIREYLG